MIIPRRAASLLLGIMALGMSATPVGAYPPADEGFLDYAEMVVAIREVANSYPHIVQLFSIGTSYEGRELWATKISDNVAHDEDEPEILFDAGLHGREHMSTEMAVALLRNLAAGFGSDPRITTMLEEREIFILFNLNPDGSEFDHSSGTYHSWRKNRQPTPGSSSIGTDINRNFEHHWGENPLNASPAADTYRGPSAWSTPEAAAFRDFVASRLIRGEQQIRVHVTFHQHGEVVLYPYGYTTTPIADNRLETMATEMARLSGYVAAQSATWAGVNVGNQMDWLYATYGMMTFTFEMGDTFYMPDESIAAETARNMGAAYYAIEIAGEAMSMVPPARLMPNTSVGS